MATITELETVLEKQANEYANYETWRSVGDTAAAQDAWEQVLYYQKRIEQLTRIN